MKKSIVAISVLVVAMMSLASVTFAASVIKSPAEIVSGLTGKTVEEVTAARQEGATYGAQAVAADQLDAFQQQRLDAYKASLDDAVANQKMTQAQADNLYANMQLRVDACDGTGIGAGSGVGMGAGRGTGTGICGGTGAGTGLGQGTGSGTGRGG
ncbi:MAG TPA: hypothetical protein VIL27_06980, partial [Clostridia bacterium]